MTDISFVIPALNEENSIGRTIDSIRVQTPDRYEIEIIVVDNGSCDTTVDICRNRSVQVIELPAATIAAARNCGAAASTGKYLVFLDADVELSSDWGAGLDSALELLHASTPQLCGNKVMPPPESENWFLKYWFTGLATAPNPGYIGSAHMITARAGFDQLKGFDATLVTGEDYDLCQRTRSLGGQIHVLPHMRVIHHGFPSTIQAFIRREVWHGSGDAQSLRQALASTTVLATAIFGGLHLCIILGLLLGLPALSTLALVILAAELISIAQVKFAHRPLAQRLINSHIVYLYLWGRLLSLIKALFKRRGD